MVLYRAGGTNGGLASVEEVTGPAPARCSYRLAPQCTAAIRVIRFIDGVGPTVWRLTIVVFALIVIQIKAISGLPAISGNASLER